AGVEVEGDLGEAGDLPLQPGVDVAALARLGEGVVVAGEVVAGDSRVEPPTLAAHPAGQEGAERAAVDAVLREAGARLRVVVEAQRTLRAAVVDLRGDLGALAQRAGDLEVEEILAEGVGLLGLERVGARVLGEGLRVDRVEGELRLLAAREAEEADVSRRSAPVAAE